MIKINQVFTYSELLKESLQLQNNRIEEIKGVLKSKKEQEQKLVQNIAVLSRYSDSLYKANTNTQLLLEKQKKMTKIGFISGATLTTLIFILIK
jgi:cell division septum initiation protein DivIVA